MELLRIQGYKLFNIQFTANQLKLFEQYGKILLYWNDKINLTSISDPQDIVRKHFLDSLSVSVICKQRSVQSMIDIGTGAGFPGIPLSIIFPDVRVVLVESIRKKANFCQEVVQELGLTHVEVVNSRAEELQISTRYAGKFDCAVSRAVAKIDLLRTYLAPFVCHDGISVAMKGKNWKSELPKDLKYTTYSYILPEETEPRVLLYF